MQPMKAKYRSDMSRGMIADHGDRQRGGGQPIESGLRIPAPPLVKGVGGIYSAAPVGAEGALLQKLEVAEA